MSSSLSPYCMGSILDFGLACKLQLSPLTRSGQFWYAWRPWIVPAVSPLAQPAPRGISSVGRASEWHSEGQGFEPPILHSRGLLQPVGVCRLVPEYLLRIGLGNSFDNRPADCISRRARVASLASSSCCRLRSPATTQRCSSAARSMPGRPSRADRAKSASPVRVAASLACSVKGCGIE